MGAIQSAFAFIWRSLDGLRKFLHLVLLLILFGFVFGALRVSIPVIPSRAALVIAPEGEIVEQLSGDPIERAIEEARGQGRAETLLWDLTDAIEAAAKDKRIPVLVLDLDYFTGAGQPTLEELARAIGKFRAQKKKVVAHGTLFLQDQYYVAAQADELYLDPMGLILIEGYDRYRMYFKEALEKLGVEVNVFRAGKFKSAVEPFVREDMSPEEREEARAYLTSLWNTYRQSVARARKLDPEALASYSATLAPAAVAARGDLAAVAKKARLVTDLKTRLEVEKRLIELVGEDESTGSFEAVSHVDYARVLHAAEQVMDGRPRIAVVIASGEILDGEHPPGTIGGESTARLIRKARLDDDVRALVLRIDSPGGSMFASEQIYRELLAVRAARKPVIASMGDLAASGGYYIAAPAERIFASPATITGSIGVFAVIPTLHRTLDKIGVNVDGVGTTALSGELRIDRPLGDDVRALLQSGVERSYEEFLERVAVNRRKTRDQVDAVAQGRVWSGADALRVGLVDQLGTFDAAVEAAARRAKLTEYQVDFIEPELSWAQELAMQVKASLIRLAVSTDDRARSMAHTLSRLGPLQRELERMSRFAEPYRAYAYCFCAAP
ncbi:MAG TPA: signal peptide peptidase SppA [Steroidobacteraceae bacterium]|nr:signal peptide peptidase SppA [Steroidobacteraceae bacterium]